MTEARRPATGDAGAPVASDGHSLTIGANGPIVINYHYLMERSPCEQCGRAHQGWGL